LDFCRNIDSDLLSIRDENETNAMFNKYLGSKLRYWIGLSDLDKNDRFEWSDGTDFNYENWGSVEPKNAGNCLCRFHLNQFCFQMGSHDGLQL
jgi:hypothetical protein